MEGRCSIRYQPDPRAVALEQSKHLVLCEELKHLYTAITRAKKNLYIFDQDEE